MRAALRMGGVSPADIGYVNAHSTSTQVGDAAEIAAIAAVFANRGKNLAISATKSATGHLLGAAGAIASIYTIMGLRSGLLPATLNLENPDEGAAVFDLVAKTAKAKQVGLRPRQRLRLRRGERLPAPGQGIGRSPSQPWFEARFARTSP